MLIPTNTLQAMEEATFMQQRGGELGAIFTIINANGIRLDTSYGSIVFESKAKNAFVYNSQNKVYCKARQKLLLAKLRHIKPAEWSHDNNFKILSWKKVKNEKMFGIDTDVYELRAQKPKNDSEFEFLVIRVNYAKNVKLPPNIDLIFPLTQEFGKKVGFPLRIETKLVTKDHDGNVKDVNKLINWETKTYKLGKIPGDKEFKVPPGYKLVTNEYNVILSGNSALEDAYK